MRFGDTRCEALSDSEGYATFAFEFKHAKPLPPHTHWEQATITADSHDQPGGAAEAMVLAPGRAIHHAIISDLDDTVLQTGLWSLMKNWRRVLASTPADRVAVPGVEDFFHHIGLGAGGEDGVANATPDPSRPFFYVSSSPWNLYGFLQEFLSLNRLPRGPMILKDWGFNARTLSKGSHGAHKSAAIASLLSFYPDLKFILIGDDSQGDVLAYAEAVAKYAGRVAGVLIRNVHTASLSPAEEDAIAAMRGAGVPVWTGSAFDAGEDMIAAMGLSTSTEVDRVAKTLERAEVEQDEAIA